MSQAKDSREEESRGSIVGICLNLCHLSSSRTFSLLSLLSACMGSVADNILHIRSWGVMDCVVEENLQVCLLTCFITQPFQRNNRLLSLVQPSQAQSLVLTRLDSFPLVLVQDFANLYSTAPR